MGRTPAAGSGSLEQILSFENVHSNCYFFRRRTAHLRTTTIPASHKTPPTGNRWAQRTISPFSRDTTGRFPAKVVTGSRLLTDGRTKIRRRSFPSRRRKNQVPLIADKKRSGGQTQRI